MSSRVAIVTGRSGGIGRTGAGRLARDGCAIIVHFGSNSDNANGQPDCNPYR
jgi:3-oxoacyl-[acyl-carrier protein] reductase